MSEAPPLVSGTDLAFAAAGRNLVEGVSLAVGPGSLQVIIGPNGAGKSTLLRLLCGELRPSRGAVTYGGVPLAEIPPWRLAALRAVLPQSARLAFPFAVAEVARIGLDGIGRGLGRREREAILADALRLADILHLAERAYPSLSGGEQARVQFARVLCQLAAGRTLATGQALFLDEPTASLDLRHQSAILEAVDDLRRDGVGVVAILHDLNLAAAYADTLVVLADGRLVARGSPAAILRDDLIAEIFRVRWPVGRIPAAGQPFILPQRMLPGGNTEPDRAANLEPFQPPPGPV
jgi:iron complex transport system ATP-binding protein